MIEQRIKYRGSYGYNKKTKQGYYILFDFINNTSFKKYLLNNTTEEECKLALGAAQKDYYNQYPRFLPKGINIANDPNFNFQLHLLGLDNQPIYIGKFITVQDAILAKKSIIAMNVE